jgi:hypothetical protein
VDRLDLADASLVGVQLVEWPERGEGLLPPDHLLVRIEHTGPDARRLTLVPNGPRAAALLATFTRAQTATTDRDSQPGAPGGAAPPSGSDASPTASVEPEAARPWS